MVEMSSLPLKEYWKSGEGEQREKPPNYPPTEYFFDQECELLQDYSMRRNYQEVEIALGFVEGYYQTTGSQRPKLLCSIVIGRNEQLSNS